MLIQDVATILEQFAPLQLQVSYDNAGLCIGNPKNEVSGILLAIDITEEVLDEAILKKCNLIISHHPLIFSGLKKITGKNYIERCIVKAIQNNISIYSAHTNADSVFEGVNHKICEKIGLVNCEILDPLNNGLIKLVTFVPLSHAQKVRDAIFEAGAGHIGNYDCCSFNTLGDGTFKATGSAKPFVGQLNQIHTEPETRIETILPRYLEPQVIQALKNAHPYEEVAFDIYPVENKYITTGMGMIGDLPLEIDELLFLKQLKNIFQANGIKHTNLLNKKIKKVAVCGGSGSSLLQHAIRNNADIFITGDFKYHQFFDADRKIIIADIGHYESEQFTKELFYDLLIKYFPNFALHFSSINTNPINYL
jgi:dinuclear metal center YbgI/SA1388 family protein